MAPSTTALALLALLSTADGARELLAHKPNGGSSLHILAITDNSYYLSNGNGTYAGNATKPTLNSAFNTAVTNTGVLGTPAVGGGAQAKSVANTRWLNGVGNGATLATYNTGYGITGIAFPSKTLGIAVGLAPSADTAGTFTGAGTVGNAAVPSILITVDQGTTWQAVTGFSAGSYLASTATVNGGLAFANGQPAASTAAALTNFPAPDLAAVACASRSLCWAVGGYFPVGGAAQALTAGAAEAYPTRGHIFISTNGGTFWKLITFPATMTTSTGPLVGGLLAVASDAAGRNVFAVGAPSLPANTVTVGTNTFTTQTLTSVSFTTPVALSPLQSGTILYSGASGAQGSWVAQTAPAIPGYHYGLNTVAVLRGHVAFAAGGNPLATGLSGAGASAANFVPSATSTPPGALSATSGVILGTTNGGLSWVPQSLPNYLVFDSTSPTPVARNATQQAANLPQINSIAFQGPSNSTYNGWAVGNSGFVLMTTLTVNAINTNSFNLPFTTWSVRNIIQAQPLSGFLDLYGIMWDNMKLGYIYGQGIILSTHDGGVTWVAETPNPVVVSATTVQNVVALATVPTTY